MAEKKPKSDRIEQKAEKRPASGCNCAHIACH